MEESAWLPSGPFQDLPSELLNVLRDTDECEFATKTPSGDPLGTPVFRYLDQGISSINIATGLAYPAKARRVRTDPRVGLLFAPSVHAADPAIAAHKETAPSLADEPIVLVHAEGAVLDTDIQANTDRYVQCFMADHADIAPDWNQAREAIWYWARVWIECRPISAYWWPRGLADLTEGRRPKVWTAPDHHSAEPPHPSPWSVSEKQLQPEPVSDLKERTERALQDFPCPVVTLISDDGFPSPLPVPGATLAGNRLILQLPPGMRSPHARRASASFGSRGVLRGHLVPTSETEAALVGERFVGGGPSRTFGADPETRERLLGRLDSQLRRLGQPRPVVRPPKPHS